MCGIFGVVSKKKDLDCVIKCLNGLKKLEYRGYDSSGIAGVVNGSLQAWKEAGKIGSLEKAVTDHPFQLEVAIAHTRWATHGKPSQINAHPQFDENHTLAIVHNGIIENHHVLRETLKKFGVNFRSETDSEVIAQLIAYHYEGDIVAAVALSLKELKGSLAIAVIHKDHPDKIIAAARECPLAVATDGHETFLSSDPNAFTGKDLRMLFLHHDEIAMIKGDSIEVYNTEGTRIEKEQTPFSVEHCIISKNGFKHYMLKEIHEQPLTLQQTLAGRFSDEYGIAVFEEMAISPKELQSAQHIIILACGSSWHAGTIAASMLENMARIPTKAEIASEFRYTNPIVSDKTLVIAISQSGETADTIAAMREAKAKGAKIISICNAPYSTLSRESDTTLQLKAGPEISVCSTKAFTSQLALLSLFTLYMARLRHFGKHEGQLFIQELKKMPNYVRQVLALSDEIKHYAKKYAHFENFFFLGRRYMVPTCSEAALKLKEISYVNATSYPAGELKHGPIALIDPNLPVIALCGNEQTYDKLLSNLMEVKARSGRILAFVPHDCHQIESITRDIIRLPRVCDELASIPYSVALQLFAYEVAVERGTEIDQPRNLAKSVTVE